MPIPMLCELLAISHQSTYSSAADIFAASAEATTATPATYWKEISEIVKNVVEVLAIFGGLFAWRKWLRERHDRAIDVLAELEDKFTKQELSKARSLVAF